MKFSDKAQNVLDQLLASGDGNPKTGGIIFGTTTIYNAGRAAGMKFREIQETFMTDAVKVGYGKYDLNKLKKDAEWESAADQPSVTATQKVAKKTACQSQDTLNEKMIKESANWEVVYDSATDETLQRNW